MRLYFFGAVAALTLMFTAIIGLIRAQPYTPGALAHFLTPPEHCRVPCFMGVRPGHTTIAEALPILRANDNIRQVEVENSFAEQVISWRWIDDDTSFQSYAFYVENQQVTRPRLPQSVALGELLLALGEPESVSAAYTNEYVRRMALVFEYPSRGFHIFVAVYPCEVKQRLFWDLRQQLSLEGSFYIGLGDANFARTLPRSRVELSPDTWATQIRSFCTL